MAYSILLDIFSPSFLRFLLLLTLVNKSFCHSSPDTSSYVAEESTSDFVLCRQCGADIADSGFVLNQLSPEAEVRVNQTLFGRKGTEVQILTNPLGIRFQIITLSSANCVGVTENWHEEFSWFPGYAWKICICNHCGGHLGWMFERVKTATIDRAVPSREGFYALILDNLLSEHFANSLIVIPKSYRN